MCHQTDGQVALAGEPVAGLVAGLVAGPVTLLSQFHADHHAPALSGIDSVLQFIQQQKELHL